MVYHGTRRLLTAVLLICIIIDTLGSLTTCLPVLLVPLVFRCQTCLSILLPKTEANPIGFSGPFIVPENEVYRRRSPPRNRGTRSRVA